MCLNQGALPAGRQTRRFQVPASVQLRAVLRSPAAQREDEGGAGERVQEGCGRSPRPAGHGSPPVPGLLHPHTCWNQSGKTRRVHSFHAKKTAALPISAFSWNDMRIKSKLSRKQYNGYNYNWAYFSHRTAVFPRMRSRQTVSPLFFSFFQSFSVLIKTFSAQEEIVSLK